MSSTQHFDVYIGLGSNLDQPLQQVRRACDELKAHPQLSLVKVSPWYNSKPVGPAQPDYVNGAALLKTCLTAEQLLDILQSIEKQHQRVRAEHWGPRTLDLDILLYGNQCIRNQRLTIPHQHLHERSFALQPLHDISPNLALPNGTLISSLLARLGTDDLRLISEQQEQPFNYAR